MKNTLMTIRQTRCPFPRQRPSRASLAQSALSRPHPAGPTGLTPTHRTALLLAGAKGVRGWFAGTVFRVKDGDGYGVGWVVGKERGPPSLCYLAIAISWQEKRQKQPRRDGMGETTLLIHIAMSRAASAKALRVGGQAALIMPFSRMPTVSTASVVLALSLSSSSHYLTVNDLAAFLHTYMHN